MVKSWENWCRLCAKQENNEKVEFIKLDAVMDLSVLVQKHFFITVIVFLIKYDNYLNLLLLNNIFFVFQISPYDESPKSFCNECVTFLFKLEKFAIKCCKVDTMYLELISNKNIDITKSEVDSVRYKYDVDEEEVSYRDYQLMEPFCYCYPYFLFITEIYDGNNRPSSTTPAIDRKRFQIRFKLQRSESIRS